MKQLEAEIAEIAANRDRFPAKVVDLLLATAQEWGASDLHLLPERADNKLQTAFRINGVLEPGPSVPMASNVVSRLKVLANLLTYRTDVPQEGRVKNVPYENELDVKSEIRVSTFPTIHGEKAVVRFFVGSGDYRNLSDLGFPETIETGICEILSETSGLLVACGPAGSGKTTTLYACLRHVQQVSSHLRSLCTLEDPVEAVITGVAQSQVRVESGFTYQRGIISLMRQDPDVIMVGEIRDRETAEVVFQASLTGHLILSSFHSASAADAVSRLLDMGIEPYVLRSTLSGLLAQRLVRRSCRCSAGERSNCEICLGSGYAGRLIIAELMRLGDAALNQSILAQSDARAIQARAIEAGMTTQIEWAKLAIDNGVTTAEECLRVFGSAMKLTPENLESNDCET